MEVDVLEYTAASTLVVVGGPLSVHERLRTFRLKALFPPKTEADKVDCRLLEQTRPSVATNDHGNCYETQIGCCGHLRADLIKRLRQLL